MNIDAYLERIGYYGAREPSDATLRELHQAHLLAVPFENLNIVRGWPIVLSDTALFDKIVKQRRGGFCYELNGLFAALLRGLGYQADILSARVSRAEGDFGPEFDHLTLLVRPPLGDSGPWLADVGFGDAFHMPLRLLDGLEQPDRERDYMLARAGQCWVLLERERGAAWTQQYSFTLQPRQYTDFAAMCYYHQTSPESTFTRKLICSRATPGGRVTLSDLRLITRERGQSSEQVLADADAAARALHAYFGIAHVDERR